MTKVKTLYKISLISIALILLLVLSTASAVTVESASPTIVVTQITTSGSASSPAIYGDKIVWSEYRNGNLDTYMYDLSTKKETKITTNESSPGSPAIYGDKIVWDNSFDFPTEIYMYDLSTSNESLISDGYYSSYPYLAYPAIYGDKIVWMGFLDSYSDIYMYDLSTSAQTQITFSSEAYSPAIYGDKIVWIDKRNGYPDIYMYDLSTQKEKRIIATTYAAQSQPSIYEDRIVWKDQRNSNQAYMYSPDIYMYNLSTSKETRITNSGSAHDPVIYGDRIVWVDERNGYSDIYMCTISSVAPDPGLPVASFSASPTSGNAPLKVLFNDSSENAVSFNWDFGDGTYSTEKDPTHTYSTAGIYTVNLTISNENGTASKLVTINVLPTNETQITTSGSAFNPAIYGDRIVWEDWRNGNHEFYMYDLSTSRETQITINESPSIPAIYGDRIIWLDDNIYMYDLSTQKETQITTSYSPEWAWLEDPAIYGDKIVWAYRSVLEEDSQIYMYNLSTSKETQITSGSASSPAIYGDRIVWMEDRDRDYVYDIYMYELSTNKKTQITTSESAGDLAIYGDKIVWVDWRNGVDDIYMYDLSTQKETQITTSGSAYNPTIYGDKLVWQDGRDSYWDGDFYIYDPDWDIHMYDLSTKKETQITTSGSAYNPAIYGDRIVWEESRNGYSDIYMYTISSGETEPILPVANFSVSPTSGNAPLKVLFNDSSENADSFNWDFGDGTYSTEKDLIHIYSTAGIYTVNLTVSNENGTDSKLVTINVSTPSVLPVFPDYTNPPTDPNHDNLYEDINGNGIMDFDDVVAYYDNMDWIAENALVAFFDYNKNGLIDFDDVVKLYDML